MLVQTLTMMLGSAEKWGIVLSDGFTEKTRFFGFTLKDEKLIPGFSSTPKSKLGIAGLLDEPGADIIKVGFAAVFSRLKVLAACCGKSDGNRGSGKMPINRIFRLIPYRSLKRPFLVGGHTLND